MTQGIRQLSDNVGDNVGDGLGWADLFGSCAEITCAAMVIGAVVFAADPNAPLSDFNQCGGYLMI